MKTCIFCQQVVPDEAAACQFCGHAVVGPVAPRNRKKQVSEICLIVYGALLLSAGCVLSVPGNYWPWFLVMGSFAVIPIFIGPFPYRLVAVLAMGLALLLVAGDINAGKHYRERLQQIMSKHPQP